MSEKTRSMEEIVEKFLRQNTDFLERNPDLLNDLELSHASGTAVSLIEKQVQHLRDQNEALEQQLNQLIQVASYNEKLMSRLHELTLELMVLSDLPSFFERLSEALLSEFKADIIHFTLYDIDVQTQAEFPIRNLRRDDPLLQPLSDQLERNASVCGRLNNTKRNSLFGDDSEAVKSTAFIPLGEHGLMAIGSHDTARFYPGMGTLFLDLLAQVVISRLALEEPAKQRRSA
jgi:uncharacterized protein YigA (DUF484 family)